MATSLEAGMLIKSIFYCQKGSQVSQNVRYWAVNNITAGIAPTDTEFAVSLAATMKSLYSAVMSSEATFQGVGVQILQPVAKDTVFASDPAAGLGAGGALPGGVAGLIRFRTGFAGRKNRGRMYVPFPDEDDNEDPGVPTAGYITAANALGVKFVTNYPLTVLGVTANMTPLVFPADNTIGRSIISRSTATIWASCRHRSDFSASNTLPF